MNLVTAITCRVPGAHTAVIATPGRGKGVVIMSQQKILINRGNYNVLWMDCQYVRLSLIMLGHGLTTLKRV